MSPFAAIDRAITHAFTPSGRATRDEFWWFTLFVWCLYIGALVCDGHYLAEVLRAQEPDGIALLVIDIAIGAGWPPALAPSHFWTPYVVALSVIPVHSAAARRLHDAGLTSRLLALYWVPIVLVPGSLVAAWGTILSSTDPMGTLGLLVSALGCLTVILRGGHVLLLLKPSEPDANQWGAPPGCAAYGRQDGMCGMGRSPHDIYEGYISLARFTQCDLRAKEASRRAEVRALYEERVLGHPPQLMS